MRLAEKPLPMMIISIFPSPLISTGFAYPSRDAPVPILTGELGRSPVQLEI